MIQGGIMAKVQVKFQDNVLTEVSLEKEVVTIGRKSGNDILIDNLAVSGFHARIFKNGDRFVLEDMGSLNGTFVNGVKISKYTLKNNDNALVGKHVLNFILPESPEDVEQTISVKSMKLDETLVLDPQLQQKLLHKMPETKAVAKGAEPLGGFVVIEGTADRDEYELKDRVTTIGKDDNAGIRLRGLFTPKTMALVNRRKEGYFINPVGGALVKVNSERISERYDLKDGDVVEVGKLRLQFYIKE
jgi:pSer/pThr/pTyr-binding forkhead associated (FHA) protein